MAFIDLHVHSNASDGTLSPTEVVSLANEKGLSYIALTDHDTTSGITEALIAAKTQGGVTVIPGIEISCHYEGREIHMLGLFLDHTNEALNQELTAIVDNRKNRNQRMIARFQEAGYPITLEKLQHGNPDTIVTRAHFARVLVEEGICKTKEQAFKKYLGADCPFYIKRDYITPEHAISMIKNAGGIAVLAHPLLYKLGYKQIEDMVVALKAAGLDGIECYHSSNNMYESGKLRTMAEKYELVVTGGSDFHGENKPDIMIGVGRGGMRITEEILFRIKKDL